MLRPGALVLVLSLTGFASAACTTTDVETPASQSASVPSESGAPPLTLPSIDVSDEKADPCSLIPPVLQEKYGLAGPGRQTLDDVTGPTCGYVRRTQADPVVTVGINTKSMGLAGLYQRSSNFAEFEPIVVAGYPGVIVNPRVDPEGCILDVAVSDTELVVIGLRNSGDVPTPTRGACDKAEQIMTDVFTNVLL